MLYIAAMILPVYPTKNPMQIHHELPKEIRPGHGVHSCPALLWTRKPWVAALQLPRELKIWCPCAFHVHFSKKLGKMISQLMAMFDYVHRGKMGFQSIKFKGRPYCQTNPFGEFPCESLDLRERWTALTRTTFRNWTGSVRGITTHALDKTPNIQLQGLH